MAIHPILKQKARRIAGALLEFARENGWGPDDYSIYYRINARWERIYFILVAREFDPKDMYQNYARVKGFLETKLADDPRIVTELGLAVRSKQEVEKGGTRAINPDYREYRKKHRTDVSN